MQNGSVAGVAPVGSWGSRGEPPNNPVAGGCPTTPVSGRSRAGAREVEAPATAESNGIDVRAAGSAPGQARDRGEGGN